MACSNSNSNHEAAKTPEWKDLHFLKYSSYVGIDVNNGAGYNDFSLLVYLPRHDAEKINNVDDVTSYFLNECHFYVKNGKEKKEVALNSVIAYAEDEKGELYSLCFNVHNLDIGTYLFDELELVSKKTANTSTYPIGNWYFDVRSLPKDTDIELQEATGISSDKIDFFAATFLNVSEESIVLLDAPIYLDNAIINPEITEYTKFDDIITNKTSIGEGSTTLSAKESKSFKFDYSKSDIVNNNVYLKPFIEYEIDGEYKSYLIINPAEFIPMPDENILYNWAAPIE